MVFFFIWSLLLFFPWDVCFNFFLFICRKLRREKNVSTSSRWQLRGVYYSCVLNNDEHGFTTYHLSVLLGISWILNQNSTFLLYCQFYPYYIYISSNHSHKTKISQQLHLTPSKYVWLLGLGKCEKCCGITPLFIKAV